MARRVRRAPGSGETRPGRRASRVRQTDIPVRAAAEDHRRRPARVGGRAVAGPAKAPTAGLPSGHAPRHRRRHRARRRPDVAALGRPPARLRTGRVGRDVSCGAGRGAGRAVRLPGPGERAGAGAGHGVRPQLHRAPLTAALLSLPSSSPGVSPGSPGRSIGWTVSCSRSSTAAVGHPPPNVPAISSTDSWPIIPDPTAWRCTRYATRC